MKNSIIGIIYVHRNKVNNKCYVGQTTQWTNTNRRFRKDSISYASYKSCSVFYKALNKYGWDNFETEVLYYSTDQDDLTNAEEYYIRQYKSLAPNGYNSEYFVKGVGKRHESVGRKISKAKIKYYENPENHLEAINKKQHKIFGEINHKHCPTCKTWHPLINFRKNKTRWDGASTYCKECQSKREGKNPGVMFLRHVLNDELLFLSINPNYKKQNGPIPK